MTTSGPPFGARIPESPTPPSPSPSPNREGPHGALPGFLAMHRDDPMVRDAFGTHVGVTTAACGGTSLTSWGLTSLSPEDPTFTLSRVARTERGEVSPSRIADAMRDDPASLKRLLPPFAAVRGAETGVTMVADSMGFRQLYHSTRDAAGRPALSTSALLAGWARGAELDDTAVAVQSLLGWQLGQRTLFQGVNKLAPDAVAHLDERGVRLDIPDADPEPAITLDEAVPVIAALLRTSLNALLDDHPDAVLQLTGGQDSRLLLSAIPVARRRDLRAMTLGAPESGDVFVASRLAERYGLRHEVHGFSTLEGLGSAEAWELARKAAMRLDGMADPIALAALDTAEAGFDQGVRISGLGGEVARGFYYVGMVRERAFTSKDAQRLAAWRMFANEAVEPDLLNPEFSTWARAAADREVTAVMAAAGDEWFHATDELYLRHRMQRWAGLTDTAVGNRRIVINPMLCQQFLSIASRLPPAGKAHSQFLARLQMELDPELGRIPLEGRSAPAAAAHPGPWRSAAAAFGTARRLSRKVTQRVRRQNRPPAGGYTLAHKVVEHWREHPELLSGAGLGTFVQPQWIDGVLAGAIDPRPSSVAFLVNLIVATRDDAR
jgi:asparagine synthase (glutamine-hydrolysing)